MTRGLSTRTLVALATSALAVLLAMLVIHTTRVLSSGPLDGAERATLAVDVAVLAAGALGVAVLIGLHLRDIVVVPIRRAAATAGALADGHVDARAEEAGTRETRELAASLNRLAEENERWRRRAIDEASTQAIATVLTGVAHEIRNPLSPIVLSLGLLDAQDPAVQRIQRGVTRLEELVAALQVVTTRREHDPNPLVRAALVAVQHLLVHHPPPELRLEAKRRIAGPGAATVQALMALLVNAIEGMPRGSVLRIATRDVDGDAIEVTVRNPGSLPPEVDARQPFVTSKAGHAGLGLSLAEHALGEIGGRITLREEGGAVEATMRLPAW